jgi:hypothetical protein
MRTIELPSNGIGQVADEECGRYGLENVVITPAGTDHAALLATNGRVLAVRMADAPGDGELQATRVRADKLPKYRHEVVLDGGAAMVRARDGLQPAEGTTGRYPDVTKVVPDSVAGRVRVDIDLDLLLALANAIVEQPTGKYRDATVTLWVGDSETNNAGIPVQADAGFGVLMPKYAADRADNTWTEAVRAWKTGYRPHDVSAWHPGRVAIHE